VYVCEDVAPGVLVRHEASLSLASDEVRRVPADLMLLTVCLIWSLNFSVSKFILDEGFQPLAYSALRFSLGALAFAAVTYALEGSFRVRRRDAFVLLAAALIGIWLNQIGFVYGLELAGASTTALVFGTTPVFVVLLAALSGVERLSARFLAAAIVSFLGVALVAAGGGGSFEVEPGGVALALLGAASWAVYSVAIAPLMRRYSPFRISAIVLLGGAPVLLLSGAAQIADQDFDFSALVWIACLFALVGPLFLTNILWFSAIDRVGPSRAAVFANLVPFLAPVFAFFLVSERLGTLQLVGGLAIGLGILLARRPAPVPAPE
jgi:drug/metabolite transporter (DMT)-like permease